MSWKQMTGFSRVIEPLTGDRSRVTWYTGTPWKPSLLYQDSSGQGKLTVDRLPMSLPWKQMTGFSRVIEPLTGDRSRVTSYTGTPWKPSLLYQDSSGTG